MISDAVVLLVLKYLNAIVWYLLAAIGVYEGIRWLYYRRGKKPVGK